MLEADEAEDEDGFEVAKETVFGSLGLGPDDVRMVGSETWIGGVRGPELLSSEETLPSPGGLLALGGVVEAGGLSRSIMTGYWSTVPRVAVPLPPDFPLDLVWPFISFASETGSSSTNGAGGQAKRTRPGILVVVGLVIHS